MHLGDDSKRQEGGAGTTLRPPTDALKVCCRQHGTIALEPLGTIQNACPSIRGPASLTHQLRSLPGELTPTPHPGCACCQAERTPGLKTLRQGQVLSLMPLQPPTQIPPGGLCTHTTVSRGRRLPMAHSCPFSKEQPSANER